MLYQIRSQRPVTSNAEGEEMPLGRSGEAIALMAEILYCPQCQILQFSGAFLPKF